MDIILKPVKPTDWKFILMIRNQDDVRKACHDTSTIDFETHKKYMKKIEDDPNSHQWIVEYDGENVGHTKIVEEEFGYMIKDGFRGKGIGTQIYYKIFEKAKKLGIKKICAEIKINQPIPLKVALKVGFKHNKIIEKNNKPYAYFLEKEIQ